MTRALAEHKGDAATQVEGCGALFAIATHATDGLAQVAGAGVGLLVLRAMSDLESLEEMQEVGARLLGALAGHAPVGIGDWSRVLGSISGCIERLGAAVQAHHTSARIVVPALRAITQLMPHDAGNKWVMDAASFGPVVVAMLSLPADAAVQGLGCQIIRRTATSNTLAEKVAAAGAIPALVAALAGPRPSQEHSASPHPSPPPPRQSPASLGGGEESGGAVGGGGGADGGEKEGGWRGGAGAGVSPREEQQHGIPPTGGGQHTAPSGPVAARWQHAASLAIRARIAAMDSGGGRAGGGGRGGAGRGGGASMENHAAAPSSAGPAPADGEQRGPMGAGGGAHRAAAVGEKHEGGGGGGGGERGGGGGGGQQLLPPRMVVWLNSMQQHPAVWRQAAAPKLRIQRPNPALWRRSGGGTQPWVSGGSAPHHPPAWLGCGGCKPRPPPEGIMQRRLPLEISHLCLPGGRRLSDCSEQLRLACRRSCPLGTWEMSGCRTLWLAGGGMPRR